ncbi:hypothetical protein ACP70R_009191 [Stipagrostis hirtigluma subsp. patula]
MNGSLPAQSSQHKQIISPRRLSPRWRRRRNATPPSQVDAGEPSMGTSSLGARWKTRRRKTGIRSRHEGCRGGGEGAQTEFVEEQEEGNVNRMGNTEGNGGCNGIFPVS